MLNINPNPKPIRILHITTVDTSLRYLLLNQLLSIKKDGYCVETASSPGTDIIIIESNGIKHYAVPMQRSIKPLKDIKSLWELYKLLRHERFTIVHTHNPKPGLIGQLAARIAGVPIIVNTLHGLYFHEKTPFWGYRMFIMLETLAAWCSDVILSQSNEDIQTLLKEKVCAFSKIKYLGNGIDLQLFCVDKFSQKEIQQKKQELGFDNTAKIISFVGRLAAKRKGFFDFLCAAKILSEVMPSARFLIIGEPDQGKDDLVDPNLIYQYGIADKCTFLGQLANEELPLLYKTMDVLVLPSLFEGVPRVIMEASAMGVPIVATDVKGNREAVEHNGNGLLVPYGNPQAIAEAVLEILTSPTLAKQMGQMGQQIARCKFDERIVFDRVKAEYSRLLQEKGINCQSLEKAELVKNF